MRGEERRAWIRQATPAWADRSMIAAIYRDARHLKKLGFDVQVDHIVPIAGARVCGLHVPHNLRVIDRHRNVIRSNHSWPRMPMEQADIFERWHAPEIWELVRG